MYKEETELLDSENNYISFYDVVLSLEDEKYYLVVPIGHQSKNPILKRINIKTGNPTGKTMFPINSKNSMNYKIIGNRGRVNE